MVTRPPAPDGTPATVRPDVAGYYAAALHALIVNHPRLGPALCHELERHRNFWSYVARSGQEWPLVGGDGGEVAQQGGDLMCRAEVAEELGVSERTVRRLNAKGLLPVVRPSPGTVRIRRQHLDEYIEQHGSRDDDAA